MRSASSLSGIRKVLIVRLGAFGDIIHTVPAQQRIRECLSECEIHWITEQRFVPFLEAAPGIARIWVAGLKTWSWPSSLGPFLRLVRALRRERFDAAIDFQGLLKSAILARAAGARLTIGPAQTRERLASTFYSRRPPVVAGDRRHIIDLNLGLVDLLGCKSDGPARFALTIPEATRRRVDELLAQHGIDRPVLLNPGAGWVTKLWPPERWAELAERIRAMGLPVAISYGPGEEAVAQAVLNATISGLPSLQTSLLELAALCERARLMVAGDTGPLHLAAALGVPTVAILGPTSGWRNGPYSSADIVVKRELPCSDCYKRTCSQFICMNIQVEEVLGAVVHRLGL
jgi:heptosyltransferase-1